MSALRALPTGVALSLALCSTITFGQVKPATNDRDNPEARFEGDTFRLPTTTNPKDVYTIIIEPVGDKPRSLVLPAGATGIRLTGKALPVGDWTWRYAVTRAELPSIKVLEPSEPTSVVGYAALLRNGDAVHLNWDLVRETKSYRLSVRTDKSTDLSSAPDWGPPSNIDLMPDEFEKVGFYDLPLKANSRVEWTVTALDRDDQPIAKSSPRVVQSEAPWSRDLQRKGWTLQRSDTLSKETATKAATFGYASSQKAGAARSSAYQTEFALIWDETKRERTAADQDPLFYLRASLEARLHSSGSGKDDDALKFRFGGYRMFSAPQGELVANLKYETESKGDTKKGLFELGYTPLVVPLHRFYPDGERNAAGNFRPDRLPWSQWMLQLGAGADIGKTFSVGSSTEVRKTNFRQKATLRLDGQMNGIADALRLPQVTLYLTSTYWHLSREEDDEHTYSTLGMSFQLSKELSIEASYSVGGDAPKFTFSRNGLLGLGVKF